MQSSFKLAFWVMCAILAFSPLAHAQGCAPRPENPKIKEECTLPSGINTQVDVFGNTDIFSRFEIAKHNGERNFSYRLESCDVFIGEWSALNRWNSLTQFDLRDEENPTLGYHDIFCAQQSQNSATAAEQRRFCSDEFYRYVGHDVYVDDGSGSLEGLGCPDAPTTPYFPPVLDIAVVRLIESADFYDVSFGIEVTPGRYALISDGALSWDFGDGETAITDVRDIIDHRYQKPINATTATVTATDADGRQVIVKVPVTFTDPEKPIASFEYETTGRFLRLDNTSTHQLGDEMSFSWDFGDGTSSAFENPQHIYENAGTYDVTLTATDSNGDTDSISASIPVENGYFVEMLAIDTMPQNVEQNVVVNVFNFETDAIENFELDFQADTQKFDIADLPEPGLVSRIEKDNVFTTNYLVTPKQAGSTNLRVRAFGDLVSGGSVQDEANLAVDILPDLDLNLIAPSVETVGETVTITLTITNNELFTIRGLRVESLGISTGRLDRTPEEFLTYISGPTGPDGIDPRAQPLTIMPGETITLTWQYTAEAEGVIDLQAFISYDRLDTNGRLSQDTSGRLAIDTAAMELSELRFSGGSPGPLKFTNLRGTLTNIGNYDITEIDFELTGAPGFDVLTERVAQLDPMISPRIDLLQVGESHEFIIPFGVYADIGSATRYAFNLSFDGQADVEGSPLSVQVKTVLRGNLDRSYYWQDILSQVKARLYSDFVSFVTVVDSWADESTLGGIAVGSVTGPAQAFDKLGQGLFQAGDLAVETVETGGYNLTENGMLMWNAAADYWNAKSFEQMRVDLKDLSIDLTLNGVGIMHDFYANVHEAGSRGDFREVSRLMTNSGTNVGLLVGGEIAAEKVMGQLFAKLARAKVKRTKIKGRQKAPEPITDTTPEPDASAWFNGRLKDWDDVPEGTLLGDEHAFLAGYGGEQLDWLKRWARECNCTIVARPRPTRAVQFAAEGLNAKPMAIKLKSESPIDIEWLGGNVSDGGLVMLRKPKDPFPAIDEAIASGRLKPDDPLIDQISKRYNDKLAVFENKDEYVARLNAKQATIRNADGEVIEAGNGIVINHRGRTIITKVSVDADGYLIFDWNGKRVYSDTDLLGVNRRDGTPIDKGTHRAFMEDAAGGIDAQHHAPMQSSDFNDGDSLQKVVTEQLSQHQRDGDGGGLLMIGPEGLTKGYVDSFSIDTSTPFGSGYENYGRVTTRLTGLETRTGP